MTKISQLSDIGAGLAAGDEFIIRDISDVSTPNKKVTASGFLALGSALGIFGSNFINAGVTGESRVETVASGISGYVTTSISGIVCARTTISGYFENASGVASGVLYPVATQADIGTDPNQIPLNQYLGNLAFQDGLPYDVQVFTTSGTWVEPVNATQVRVIAIGGGGGGGSGCKGAAATNRNGGVGGGRGNYIDVTLRASEITTTVSVTIGSGGTGAASQTTNTTPGISGVAGGNTTFGSYLTAYGGYGGAGGTIATFTQATLLERPFTDNSFITKNTGGISIANTPIIGGYSQASTATSQGGVYGILGPGGGGAGGPISSANAIATTMGFGGNGASIAGNFSGGTASLTDAAAGGAGTNATANQPYGGGGGGGGQASLVGNAGAGGAGALYGGSGGGGGASVDSVGNSGAGGAGAAGICVVISW
jgi:hypothetical protein